jgi:hypothetical protein
MRVSDQFASSSLAGKGSNTAPARLHRVGKPCGGASYKKKKKIFNELRLQI